MKKFIATTLLIFFLPATVVWAQEPSNAELYVMIKKMELKFDAAIDEINRAKAEAYQAKKEAAEAKVELEKARMELTAAKQEIADMKTAPASVAVKTSSSAGEAFIKVPESRPGKFSTSVEAVFLRPSRSGLDFTINDSNSDTDPQGTVDSVESEYHASGRIGISYDLGEGKSVDVKVSTLDTSDKASATPPSGGTLWGTRLHPDSSVSASGATSAKAEYDFTQHIADIGVSQKMDLGEDVSVRMGAGVRYAQVEQKLDVLYGDGTNQADIESKDEFKGIGPNVNVGPDWGVGKGFMLFGDLGGSILVGDYDTHVKELDGSTTTVAEIKRTVRNRVVPVIEARTGIGYAKELKNGWIIGAKAGYEWQNWFNIVTVCHTLHG